MLESPIYKWLSAHASEYGFYPFSNEPWHWEYNPAGYAEKFFESDPTLQAKITEATKRKRRRPRSGPRRRPSARPS